MQSPRICGFQFRNYRVDGENTFYIGFKSRNSAETVVKASAKSEHYDLIFGEENPNSSFTCENSGETFYGKGCIPATKVYEIEMHKRLEANRLRQIKEATALPETA